MIVISGSDKVVQANPTRNKGLEVAVFYALMLRTLAILLNPAISLPAVQKI